jgi:hypothetical protein
MIRALLAATLGLLLTAAATPDDLAKGETLDYELTWLSVSGGTMRMTVTGEGADSLRITSVAESNPNFAAVYKVRDEISSLVRRDSFTTVEYRKQLVENGKQKEDATTIDTAKRIGTRVRAGKQTKVFRINPPPPYVDPLSVVYRLRTLDLTPGKVHAFTIYADGNVYAMTAKVTGRLRIKTAAGTFNTVSVEPKMNGRGGLFRDDDSRLIIWYSDDARHLPVRIRSELKFGSITAALRRVTAAPAR